jgi:hypothetical protein
MNQGVQRFERSWGRRVESATGSSNPEPTEPRHGFGDARRQSLRKQAQDLGGATANEAWAL